MFSVLKICGITNIDDANKIAKFDEVAYLGCVHFKDSKRHLEINKIAEIFKSVKEKRLGAKCVLVLVNPMIEFVKSAMKETNADIVQLSGDESSEFCQELDLYEIWKVIHIKKEEDILKINDYLNVDKFVLDTKTDNQFGGTGITFDFEIFNKAKRYSKNLVLAGGMNQDTIFTAIEMAKPEIIDISSGVEDEIGGKDIQKVEMICNLMSNDEY